MGRAGDAPFIDDWPKRIWFLVHCLQNTLATGGVVLGAFADGALKGFASVESAPLGKAGDYRDLTCLHVSAELRGRGIGRELFTRAAQWARAHGGKKLYLSAHSAVETQAFYAADGLRGGPGVQ
jgi:GNAT superfamily N-acetyltransferase